MAVLIAAKQGRGWVSGWVGARNPTLKCCQAPKEENGGRVERERGGPQGGKRTQRWTEKKDERRRKCVFTVYMSASIRDDKNQSAAVESPQTDSKCQLSLSWR